MKEKSINKTKIIDRLKKLKILVERGDENERETAFLLLNKIMEKYNIHETSISISNEPTKEFFFNVKPGYKSKELFVQVAKHTYPECRIWNFSTKNSEKFLRSYMKQLGIKGMNTMIECTDSQFLEITTLYEIYRRSLEKYIKALYTGFIYKNDLALNIKHDNEQTNPISNPSQLKQMSNSQYDLYIKAMKIAELIDKEDVHKFIP